MSASAIQLVCLKDAQKKDGGMNLPEIKNELKKLGLSTNGNRAVLRERLCLAVNKDKGATTKPAQKPDTGSVLDRLKYLFDKEEEYEEFDTLVVQWFRSLPKEKHMNTKWITDPITNDIYIIGRNVSAKKQKMEKAKSGSLEDQLVALLDLALSGNEYKVEYHTKAVQWFKSLPLEKHRDLSWLEGTPFKSIYNDAKILCGDTREGRKLLHKIQYPHMKQIQEAPQPDVDYKPILKYDNKRRVVYLEGLILKSMAKLTNSSYEHGGMLDFKIDGKFDRAAFAIGAEGSVYTPDLADFEVQFHTHPVRFSYDNIVYNCPSASDIGWVSNQNQSQVHVLFTPEGVYTLYKDRRTKHINSQKDFEELVREVSIYSVPALKNKQALERYIDFVKTKGVYMYRYSTDLNREDPLLNWPARIPIYIDPHEPEITLGQRPTFRG